MIYLIYVVSVVKKGKVFWKNALRDFTAFLYTDYIDYTSKAIKD